MGVSDTFIALPKDIANFAGGTKGELWADIGANFDASEANDTWAQTQIERLCWNAVGSVLLAGTPETFLTGEAASTFTLAVGTTGCVPIGTYGSQSKAAIVVTTAELTQGQAGDGENYVYLVRTPATGVLSLSVTKSATPPANALALGHATVTAGVIGAITQESIP